MTYVVGLRLPKAVFLFADTVLTSKSAPGGEPRPLTTTFGEAVVNRAGRYADDKALKLLNLDKIVIAIVGDSDSGQAIASTTKSLLDVGMGPREAFHSAVRSVTPVRHKVEILAAIREPPNVSLLGFNLTGEEQIEECSIGRGAHRGSMPPHFKERVHQALVGMASRPISNDRFLAAGLSYLQGRGLRDYLLEHGVGGAFTGLYVTADGVFWQKDTLYYVYSDKDGRMAPLGFVAVIIRENALLTRSSFVDFEASAQVNALITDLASFHERYRHLKLFDGPFENLVAISSTSDTTSLIEMKGQRSTSDASIVFQETSTAESISITLNPHVLATLGINPQPYETEKFTVSLGDAPPPLDRP
jgi:hypothetical protein